MSRQGSDDSAYTEDPILRSERESFEKYGGCELIYGGIPDGESVYFSSKQFYAAAQSLREISFSTLQGVSRLNSTCSLTPEFHVLAARCQATSYEEALYYYDKGLHSCSIYSPAVIELLNTATKLTTNDLVGYCDQGPGATPPVSPEVAAVFSSSALRGFVCCLAGYAEMCFRLHRYAESASAWSVLAMTNAEPQLEPRARVAECCIAMDEYDTAMRLIVGPASVAPGLNPPSLSSDYLALYLLLTGADQTPGKTRDACLTARMAFNRNVYVPALLCGLSPLPQNTLFPLVKSESSRMAAMFVAARHRLFWVRPHQFLEESDEYEYEDEDILTETDAGGDPVPSGSVVALGDEPVVCQVQWDQKSEQTEQTPQTTERPAESDEPEPTSLYLLLLARLFCSYVPEALSNCCQNPCRAYGQIVHLLRELTVFAKQDIEVVLYNLRTRCGWTPLHYAATTGNLAAAQCLVNLLHTLSDQAGQLPRYTKHFLNAAIPFEYGSLTALHLAALYGHKEIVALLLREGASPLVSGPDGKTPLHLAAEYGEYACVRLILDSCKSDYERTVISNVNTRVSVLECAVESSAYLCLRSDGHLRCLRCACAAHGALPFFNVLDVDAGVQQRRSPSEIVKQATRCADTLHPLLTHLPLGHGSSCNFYHTVMLLLNNGAHPIESGTQRASPFNVLLRASQNLNSDAVFAVLGWAADILHSRETNVQRAMIAFVNSADSRGRTPLSVAVNVHLSCASRRHGVMREGVMKPGLRKELVEFMAQQMAQLKQRSGTSAQPREGEQDGGSEDSSGVNERAVRPYDEAVDAAALPGTESITEDEYGSMLLAEGVHVARYLVAYGALANLPDSSGNSPIDYLRYFISRELVTPHDGSTEVPFLTAEDIKAFPCPPDVDPAVWHNKLTMCLSFENSVVRSTKDLGSILATRPGQALAQYISAAPVPEAEADRCANCHAENPHFICSGCKLARYCSPACQQEDWARHRQHCRAPS